MNDAERVEAEARELLAKVYTPAGVEVWLTGSKRSLGGKRPIDLIQAGEGEHILAKIRRLVGL